MHKTESVNAKDIMERYEIAVESELFADEETTMWTVRFGDVEIDCADESKANELALAFAVAIHNHAII